MIKRPNILITPTTDEKFLKLNHDYVKAVLLAGGVPILSSYDIAGIEKLIDISDGILFSGGGDVHAKYFNEELHPQASFVYPERDVFELALCGKALAANKPLLCICRGIQLLNIACGGNIIQHIENHSQQNEREEPSHEIYITPKSLLHQIFSSDTLLVNSFHHQAVGRVAPGLSICAAAKDGTIEGLEHPEKR